LHEEMDLQLLDEKVVERDPGEPETKSTKI
jgi:hypothetical protein